VLRVPSEHLRLRREDPALAGAWRDAVADAFEDALARGYVAVDFHRRGLYVLERA
jgi:predicted GNAT superfamily acetyltransferase